MPKFIVKDTLPCWVTWEYEVEAADESEAWDKYYAGDHTPGTNPVIGDSIDFAGDGWAEIEPVKEDK